MVRYGGDEVEGEYYQAAERLQLFKLHCCCFSQGFSHI